MKRNKRAGLAALSAMGLGAALLGVQPAEANTVGSLPAGTPITIDITSPNDGDIFHVPAGTVSHDITVDASGAVSEGVDAPDTAIVYVIDLSGSTNFTSPGCGGNQNPTRDGFSNRVLDCEIAALRALNSDAIAAGTVSSVGLVGFAHPARVADLSPVPGQQPLASPAADVNADTILDVDDVLTTLAQANGSNSIQKFTPYGFSSGGTNFEAAVQTACSTLAGATETNRFVVMMSDGESTLGGNALDDAATCGGPIWTFAVGGNASCTNVGSGGSLDQIAAQSPGSSTCTHVTSPEGLPELIRDLVGSSLDEVRVNGTNVLPASVDGPTTESVSATVTLLPGTNTISATAVGTDRDGSDEVSESINVTLNRRPSAIATGDAVDEGDTATVSAVGADDDGDALTYEWDLDDDGDFDENVTGSTASFVAADGDAVLAVSVRVCDSLGGCVIEGTTVTVDNVAPTVDAGADQTVLTDDVVSLAGSFSDPAGALDEDYVWDFDGLSGGNAAYGDSLPASTSFSTPGTYILTLSVTDKDGEIGTDTVEIEVLARNQAPDCSAVEPTVGNLWPPNGTFHTVGLTGATDPDGDDLTTTIDSVFQDEEVGKKHPDAIIGGDTVDLRAERDGGGDGRFYHVGYTVDDGQGGSCSGVVHVTVHHDMGLGTAADQGPLYDSTV